ncbi:Terpene synthase [Melia azedarach]|uniref:Terpene synthase n=1 Tax=Melia azedarach TaxID=155640 RepID=A0ACC1YPW9_MELAZ|nr:Terpene synthase [Melia azedarach]
MDNESGVFNKFKESNDKFKESLISNVKGMLSLYEATQLRVHEEDILEEAFAFTTTHLKNISLAADTSPRLAKYIIEALEQPFHTGVPRLEALKYISSYEHQESRNDILLKFAKVKEVARAYFVEAQWFREGFVPLFDERMSNALISACCVLVPAATFIGIKEIAGIHAFEWLQSKPKVMISSFTILRLIADLVSHKAEQERGHVASVVESYMKEYGTTRTETAERFKIMITNSWKDINEESMRPTVAPLRLINVIVNIARIAEVYYKEVDGITNPEYLKDYVRKLFIDPIPL